jgi:hypothetical protein
VFQSIQVKKYLIPGILQYLRDRTLDFWTSFWNLVQTAASFINRKKKKDKPKAKEAA